MLIISAFDQFQLLTHDHHKLILCGLVNSNDGGEEMDLNFFSHTKQHRTINPNRSIESRSLIASSHHIPLTEEATAAEQMGGRSHCGKGNEEINVQITETQHISLGAAPSKRDSFIRRPGTKDRSLQSFLPTTTYGT